jgi:phosphate transport system permease protein
MPKNPATESDTTKVPFSLDSDLTEANGRTEDSTPPQPPPNADPPSPSGSPNRPFFTPSRQDSIFRWILWFAATALLAICIMIGGALVFRSMPSLKAFGAHFLFSLTWDPVNKLFGALPFVYGTLVSSFIALLIAVPLSIGAAIFLAEVAPKWLSAPVSFAVELLAAIPSIVYGLWGIFVLIPVMQTFEGWLAEHLGFLPFFQGAPYGYGMLTAGLILAIMIIPYITAVTRDVILAVPKSVSEGSYALGATRWETMRRCVLHYGRAGIIGAIILGLGRALGETMAVTMVIGNRPDISASLFNPSYTMASVLANEFAEATYNLYVSSLIEIGLLLFVLTIIVNAIGRLLLFQTMKSAGVQARG